MSTTTHTPFTIEAEESLQAIYYSIGQSAVSIIINLMIVIWLKLAFKQELIYRILIVESATNLVGQIGFLVMWTSIIGETPHNEAICMMAAALTTILIFNFNLSNLMIACPRHFKIQASVNALPIPCDQSIFKKLQKCWAAIYMYLSLLAIVNAVSKTHAIPPYEICLHSNHFAESMSLERWQPWLLLIPLCTIVLVNIYFDYDHILPSLSAINQLENILPSTPIKTCYLSLVHLLVLPLVQLDVVDIENEGIRMIWFNTFLVVSLLKAPLIALWTHHCQKNNGNQAQPGNDLELHPIHSISSEGQRVIEMESE